ncbi:hypothetical protein O3G_MSEX009584 [Manduca sexta]|uniref:Uncharacterized protein n=1 Tax=Manduca sexta TaxID=7130 RepID=A0A921ZET4_MANSE|nr:hypothetical protein O3G_MSEX009584 [Manduca sexta]
MSDKLVCDINFYFYLTLIFGYYNDFGSSCRARCLAMLYCAFYFMIASSCFIVIVLFLNLTFIDIILGIFRISEYFLYVLISITKKNEFLKRYYKKMKLIDDISNIATYKLLRAYLITYLLVIIIYKIFIYPCVIIIYYQDVEGFLYYFIFKIIMTSSLVCGRQTVVFVMALMYCRIRSMRRAMKKNEFNCSSQGNRHPRRFIQVYETIMHTLEATDHPLKIQVNRVYKNNNTYLLTL